MSKQWQLLPAAPQKFREAQSTFSPIIVQLLFNRGLVTQAEISDFFTPESRQKEYSPWLFQNMEAAIELTIQHIKQGNLIVICGDYDADGVSASALLSDTLRLLKAKVDVWIPSRFGEGYGLNNKIVSELHSQGAKLIITVDNGIRARAEITYAQSLGIDVIVTDHHMGSPRVEDWPDCLIINPILPGETYPFRYLCGAGVAYKFAQALIDRSTLTIEDKDKILASLIDLAAIGTISDCVSLLGENRLLAQQGLDRINQKPRLGVAELSKVVKLPAGEINEWNISWQITPRLNASGRLGHASAAYELLVTRSDEEAQKLALDLNEKNIMRQQITEEIVNTAVEIIKQEQMNEKILIVLSPDLRDENGIWSEGVIGLVAGRLVERFGKPCFVICLSEGMIKGSGRSIEQYDIGASLEEGKQYLARYGGHKMACGFTVNNQTDLKSFISVMKASAAVQLQGVDLRPVLKIEAEVQLQDVTEDLIDAVAAFAPYGEDNPEPRFMSRALIIQDNIIMGSDKRHIKFRVDGMWALAFGRADEYKEYRIGDVIDIVYTVGINIFNGRREIQLKIIDLKRSMNDSL